MNPNGSNGDTEGYERLQEVETIVREGLKKHCKDRFLFDIEVNRQSDDFGDSDGEPYLNIAIVLDTNSINENETPWLLQYITMLRNRLMEIGVEEFPVTSFFLKSEWARIKATSESA